MKARFERGQATYTCRSCKKTTRNTGDEGQCQLCRDCFNLSGIENHLSDYGMEDTKNNYASEIRAIFSRRPELKPLFDELVLVNPE